MIFRIETGSYTAKKYILRMSGIGAPFRNLPIYKLGQAERKKTDTAPR